MPTPHPTDRETSALPGPISKGEVSIAEDRTRKRLLAIDVLLEAPDEISEGLEAELYALRDRLHPTTPGGS
jgi:hypothetical protein